MPKIKARGLHSSWLHHRELGHRFPLGHSDRFSKDLYSSLMPCNGWDQSEHLRNAVHGGVFNLEFSPDSSLLVAACEKKSILMFDPLCRKLIHAVDNAHRDCVNCVRFLDSRVFATCSDDSTVALWDARNLKSQIRTLHGHSNWVKNIEFSPRDGLLVTSGFDGSIYTWDINSYTETGFVYTRVFHTNGLMRTRLNPDATKMVICTTSGYLMIVHDLDLTTLQQDLAGFKPNMYRLMQISQTTIPVAATYTHLFSKSRKVNRVEIVADFPKGDDAEVVSSLQIHPQGWCALSRNISNNETSEWTCVHDIQDLDYPDTESESDFQEAEEEESLSRPGHNQSNGSNCETGQSNCAPAHSSPHLNAGASASSGSSQTPSSTGNDTAETGGRRDTDDLLARASELSASRGFSAASVELHVSSADVWEALVAIREARIRRERERERERMEHEFSLDQDSLPRGFQFRLSAAASAARRIISEEVANEASMSDVSHGSEGRAARFRILVHRTFDDEPAAGSSPRRNANQADNSDAPDTQVSSSSSRSRPAAVSGNTVNSPAVLIRPHGSNGSGAILIVNHRDMTRSSGSASSTEARRVGPTRVYRVNTGTIKPDHPGKLNRQIHQNMQRLTHYIEEPNVGKGFIKELCFSSDGRLICSPYGYGVRLLAFSPDCAELSSCVPVAPPVRLYELASHVCHTDIVVSTKFSPQHCLLVSGCLTGKIVWHQPVV